MHRFINKVSKEISSITFDIPFTLTKLSDFCFQFDITITKEHCVKLEYPFHLLVEMKIPCDYPFKGPEIFLIQFMNHTGAEHGLLDDGYIKMCDYSPSMNINQMLWNAFLISVETLEQNDEYVEVYNGIMAEDIRLKNETVPITTP